MDSYVYLAHHGIKGMKWGLRRYQNPDGSLTPMGRIRYGVGKARETVSNAAGSVKETIRKKVAPTNSELNAQIRKQKSKNLNKEKRRQLKELKRGRNPESSTTLDNGSSKGQHRKFSELSDEDIRKRINRLKSEVELAELERTKNFGPGRRMVDDILKSAAKDTASKLLSKALTDAGSKAIESWLETDSEKLKRESTESANRMNIRKEKSTQAKAYKSSGKYTDAQIAKKIGVNKKDLPYYLYDDQKKDKKKDD